MSAETCRRLSVGSDAVEHPVQGVRQAVEIVAGAAHRYPLREVAGDDRLRRAAEGLDALEQERG